MHTYLRTYLPTYLPISIPTYTYIYLHTPTYITGRSSDPVGCDPIESTKLLDRFFFFYVFLFVFFFKYFLLVFLSFFGSYNVFCFCMFIAFFLSCFLTLLVSYCQIPTVNFNDFQETSSSDIFSAPESCRPIVERSLAQTWKWSLSQCQKLAGTLKLSR